MEAIEKDIERFLAISSGHGSGNGNGFSYGSGLGYGNGSGHGSGHGSGNGSEHGYGYGAGSGAGAGYDAGDGDGCCNGDDIKEFDGRKIYYVDNVPTLIYAVSGDVARGAILNDDLTLKPCTVAKFGSCYEHKTRRKAGASYD